MRWITSGVAILAGVMGMATVVGAENRGLSPIIMFCRDTESLSPESAFNSFTPISTEFLRQIGARHGHTIEELKQYRVTLVEPPKHGVVENDYLPSHSWIYRPTEDYKGTDRVIFLVESQSKQYKVVVNFWVVGIIDENRKVQECESINFGTQNGSSTTVTGLTAISLRISWSGQTFQHSPFLIQRDSGSNIF